jgi:hypothetical protein
MVQIGIETLSPRKRAHVRLVFLCKKVYRIFVNSGTANVPCLAARWAPENKNECMKFNWKKIHRNVRKLQARIVKAVCENKFNKAKSLMWLLVNSYYAKLIAVFRVITNKGGKTPGVDNVVWNVKTDLVPVV